MDFRGDPRVLPPEQYYSAMAKRVSDLDTSRSYMALAKSMTASHSQLLGFLRNGTAFQLADDTIVAGTNPSQVNAAVLSAKAAYGKGGPCDNARFRSWLEGRCKELGLNPPEWAGADAVGTAGGKGSGSLSSSPGGARPGAASSAGARARSDPALAPSRPAQIAEYDGRSDMAGKSLAKAGGPLQVVIRPDGTVHLEMEAS